MKKIGASAPIFCFGEDSYASVALKASGITSVHNGSKLVMSMYVYDGYSISIWMKKQGVVAEYIVTSMAE